MCGHLQLLSSVYMGLKQIHLPSVTCDSGCTFKNRFLIGCQQPCLYLSQSHHHHLQQTPFQSVWYSNSFEELHSTPASEHFQLTVTLPSLPHHPRPSYSVRWKICQQVYSQAFHIYMYKIGNSLTSLFLNCLHCQNFCPPGGIYIRMSIFAENFLYFPQTILFLLCKMICGSTSIKLGV